MSPSITLDRVCADAEDVALAALLEDVPAELVGPRVEVVAEGDRVVTHYFECLDAGYSGWRWAVTVARASRAKTVTVNAVTVLPGPDSLLAPPWVPWQERIEAGDLRDGDVLVTNAHDPRLVPGFTGEGDAVDTEPAAPGEDDELRPLWWELGLGRVRVLSEEGRAEAADRWVTGERGPGSRTARSAPGDCISCGFFVSLAGALGQAFGVCANEYSPADGEVVAVDFGCGAHSEASVAPIEVPGLVLDETDEDLESVDFHADDDEAEPDAVTELAEVSEVAEVAETTEVEDEAVTSGSGDVVAVTEVVAEQPTESAESAESAESETQQEGPES